MPPSLRSAPRGVPRGFSGRAAVVMWPEVSFVRGLRHGRPGSRGAAWCWRGSPHPAWVRSRRQGCAWTALSLESEAPHVHTHPSRDMPTGQSSGGNEPDGLHGPGGRGAGLDACWPVVSYDRPRPVTLVTHRPVPAAGLRPFPTQNVGRGCHLGRSLGSGFHPV